MRLIDADELMKECAIFVAPANNSDFAEVPTWNDAISLIGSAPTIDAVPVVRCKECKFYEAENHNCLDEMAYARTWGENDYCSFGERKDDATD